MPVAWTGKRISQLHLYKRLQWNLVPHLGVEHIPFIILYAILFHQCYMTIGEQYVEAIAKAERKGIDIPNTEGYMRNKASKFFEEGFEDEPIRSWFNFDPDAVPVQKKEFRLPSQYLPGFWPVLFLGTVVTLHVLMQLLQHWSIKFKCLLHFRKVERTEDATHVRVIPQQNSGKPGVYKLEKSVNMGVTFTFHHRKYQWDPSSNVFEKIRCRTDMELSKFKGYKGRESDLELDMARARYGTNKFEMQVPTFKDLYIQQILSPFTCFQLFCVLLWCLDEYWQYSLFTLFMILSFEGATVFTRIKNMGMLRGMSSSARPIKVFRNKKWIDATTIDLVPGDLFSMPSLLKDVPDSDIVPCDCLLMSGSAVLNEATLTGESVPQMKEALNEFTTEKLNIKGADKVHVLFGGTKVLMAEPTGKDETGAEVGLTGVPDPGDKGCICYVLRTAFSSSQGKLVRMIEGSTEKVRGDVKDTAILLLMLLCFAVASASYVLKEGMHDDERSKYELLLHCILIITSVVPPELPMQMALAVNTALMTMLKLHIFCTEPFRVPIAGKVDVCLFDKTGTLTTDELVAVGVSAADKPLAHGKGDAAAEASTVPLAAMTEASAEATLVIGGCQALVLVDGKLVGDPIEAAAFNAIDWEAIGPRGQLARPKTGSKQVNANVQQLMGPLEGIEILTRHHFASKLQRMSTVVRSKTGGKAWVLAKGSPEAIGKLLLPGSRPQLFDATALALAKEGMRILALALKPLEGAEEVKSCVQDRSVAEQNLLFAGFVAFTCRVRKDTESVISSLREGAHQCIMVTGDAILTAIHVAKEVGLSDPSKESILILDEETGQNWTDYGTNEIISPMNSATDIAALYARYNLCTTGPALAKFCSTDPTGKRIFPFLCVYARMTPDEKELLIATLNTEAGKVTMMCGDGANDVGALKQAHVGVALLGGFGDLNVDRGADDKKKKKNEEEAENCTAILTPEKVKEIEGLKIGQLKSKLREMGVEPNDYPSVREKSELIKLYRSTLQKAAVQKHDSQIAKMTPEERKQDEARKKQEMIRQRQEDLEKEVERLKAKGESMATLKASWNIMQREMEKAKEMRKKQTGTPGFVGHAARLAQMMEEMEGGEGGPAAGADMSGDLPMVKIGDASIAAPFTAKLPSIKATYDIIRQGRCTLVTTIQMYQILALNCLISAYSLSVLYLDGVKYGDMQMTALGLLMSASFITISRSEPLNKLSKVRPFGSIFHPALFVSILGQFTLHLTCMMTAVRMAKDKDPNYKPDIKGKFEPNLLNSVVFLVNAVQQVSVFAVNLKGPPFMNGILENRALLYSLGTTFMLVFCCASETIPQLNKYLKLQPFPDLKFRNTILTILGVDIFCSFLWDRLMVLIFAPKVLFASVEGMNLGHVMTMVKTLIFCFGIVYFASTFDYDEETNAKAFIASLQNVTWPGEAKHIIE